MQVVHAFIEGIQVVKRLYKIDDILIFYAVFRSSKHFSETISVVLIIDSSTVSLSISLGKNFQYHPTLLHSVEAGSMADSHFLMQGIGLQ